MQVTSALFAISPEHEAAIAGQYASWHTSPTYLGVREMHTRIGWINDSTRECRDVMHTDFCSSFTCPPNTARRSCLGLFQSCLAMGMPCPNGVRCVC